MSKIYVYQDSTLLFNYESDIIPQVGDIYAALEFEDAQQRTVKSRILNPKPSNLISIVCDYSFPNLSEKDKKINQKELV